MSNNEKIVVMNTKLFTLDEKKKKLNLQETRIKKEMSKNKILLDIYDLKSKNSLKVLAISALLMLISIHQLSTGQFTLPIDVIPRVIIPMGGIVGSITCWTHFSAIADEFLYKKFNYEVELSKVHTYQNEIDNIKSLAQEMLYSREENENNLDEINAMLDGKMYLENVIHAEKEKTRGLVPNRKNN